MCFVTKNPKLKKRIAKRNIKVGKCVNYYYGNNNCESRFMEFIYKPNKLNPEITLKLVPCHTQSSLVGNEGYHSYKLDGINYINALFIIPKGSEYYYSQENQEYFSSNIIFKKKFMVSKSRKKIT